MANFFKTSSFSGQIINIDGNFYEDCVFEKCILVYSGKINPSFVRCTFNDSRFEFADFVSNTLVFLRAIYHGMGDGGKNIVDSTFESIKSGDQSTG